MESETVRPTFTFRRFVNGQERAEGVRIELAGTLEQAVIAAVRLCPEKGTVLVYDPDSDAIERLTRERDEAREARDHIAGLHGKLWGERDALRAITSKCAEALANGAFVSPDCTIEFIQELPSEIGLHVASLVEDRDTWKERADAAGMHTQRDNAIADRDALRAEVERLKDANDIHFGNAMAASFAYDKAMKELAGLRDWADARVSVLEKLALESSRADAAEAALATARGIDCIGGALELETQVKRAESQTVERAMLWAAQALRSIHAAIAVIPPATEVKP
jgi:hypothetical protein